MRVLVIVLENTPLKAVQKCQSKNLNHQTDGQDCSQGVGNSHKSAPAITQKIAPQIIIPRSGSVNAQNCSFRKCSMNAATENLFEGTGLIFYSICDQHLHQDRNSSHRRTQRIAIPPSNEL
ncbi:hypothetical protein TNCV_1567531 [Trichonephila clavipes]|nr:hypothetical protein TNCV_1567531 [Trichonephila clavipes]